MHFDGEVMRIFQSAGLAEKIAAVVRSSSRGMHFVNGEGRTLMIRRGIDGPGPHGWAGNWYFHQPILEGVLREGLKRFANVRVHLGHEVASVDDLDARYVVGCDGARSLVRQAIGSKHRDLGLHQPWLVVDLLCDPASPRVKALPDYTVQLCDPARPMTVVNVGGDRRRWEIMLMPGDDPARLTDPDVFWPMMSPLARARRCAARTRRRLHLPFGGAGRLAQGPAAAGRRCLPPDTALPRPGHVRGHA